MIEEIKQRIKKEITDTTADFNVEITSNADFGHYASNVAMRLAGVLKKSPLVIAKDLTQRIKTSDTDGFFEKVAAAPPGFINFWLSNKTLAAEFAKVIKTKKNYGRSKIGAGEKIQVEYISANPTGPLTLANGRGGFFGHCLANVLAFSGFEVEREYYINDAGKQILTLGKSILAALNYIPPEEDLYPGAYIQELADKNKANIKKLAADPYDVGQLAAHKLLLEIKRVVEKKSGITIDRWTSEEKDIRVNKYPEQALAIFKEKNLTYEKDGALWLKTTDFGDDKDRVLITGDGFMTYFAADAGHYIETLKRGFKKKINVFGPDHHGYVKRIGAAAKLVGMTDPQFIVTQVIRLIKNGHEYKMSKRRGTYVEFEELVDEVGADATRLFFLMHGNNSPIDFDLNIATEQSSKNPVFYIQYAYVRAKKIIRKASLFKKALGPDSEIDFSPIQNNLMSTIIQFPDLVLASAQDYQTHRLVKYGLDLARIFHNFYEQERIVGEKDKQVAALRLNLVKATLIIFENLFALLGVSKPDKM